ncbi:DUF4435 domain-containing protein [Peptostreptococcus canis]|uniref:AAA family ATPase n=1 Tax=Peptostreptococcus canis TaxID=1159213 RepID=A0ABR6TJF0_9FIRM|nr:DUF4435 domain-containing protein [Peptostreptococcus canis]MBC2575550.1 AAA family ATPase [Peptostreptococcus canis]MBP1997255.1 ABC-type cobalamin/Fe3+-siderophores transport system ATPase subunit [Peptostreptococcus canis]
MKIKLPDIDREEIYIDNKQSIILIGANGSGKTRMSIWIEENNKNISVHRISAQKSLNMPETVSLIESGIANEKFLYGNSSNDKEWLKEHGKKLIRWNDKPVTHLLNDFNELMELLVTDDYEKSIEFRKIHKSGDTEFNNETKLEKIKSVWEDVILHRKLEISLGKIEAYDANVYGSDKLYNASEMSDGERAIFYFIGEVLSVPEGSLIIIDEPENHLHNSILSRLWNSIESHREDCTFLYITHNIEFASSRINSQIVWIKNIKSDFQWEYELVDEVSKYEKLQLEILGNRQKVLLVEGNSKKSIDKKLYSVLFPDYNVIPVDNCNRVIQYTKAFQKLKSAHYTEVKGIIDRDRRSDEEILSYKSYNIFAPEVAEIENLFLIPEVIKVVCKKLYKTNYKEL